VGLRVIAKNTVHQHYLKLLLNSIDYSHSFLLHNRGLDAIAL